MFSDETLPWIDDHQFHAWRMRVRAEHAAGNLTPARRNALTALQGLMAEGNAEPSDAEVAALAHCSARTVRRARADAKRLGLLRWQRTRQQHGERVVQGRNHYGINVPASPVCPRPQKDRLAAQGRKNSKEEAQETPRTVSAQLSAFGFVSPAAAREALAAINRRRAAALGVSG
jgi:hypothetical protein